MPWRKLSSIIIVSLTLSINLYAIQRPIKKETTQQRILQTSYSTQITNGLSISREKESFISTILSTQSENSNRTFGKVLQRASRKEANARQKISSDAPRSPPKVAI